MIVNFPSNILNLLDFFISYVIIPSKNTFSDTHLRKLASSDLHLHGLNVRSKEFRTLSTELVDASADEWSFIKTPTIPNNV